MKRIIRNRPLTSDEVAEYNAVRQQIEHEKTEINDRIRERIAGANEDKSMSNPFSDADVISSYTTEQAINDGTLVEPFPDKFPKLLLTSAVYADIMAKPTTQELEERGGVDEVVDDRTPAQRIIPLFQDAVLAMRAAIAKDKHEYLVTSNVLDGNITGKKLWIALNEWGGLTILYPEDY